MSLFPLATLLHFQTFLMEALLTPLGSIRTSRLAIFGLIILLGVGCVKKSASQPSSNSPPSGGNADPSRGVDGRWKAVSAEVNGEPVPAEIFGVAFTAIEISGTRLVGKYAEQVVAEGSIQVDAGRKPMTIELSLTVLRGGQAGKTVRHIGIYEVSGDSFKLCLADSDKPRPTAFETRPGSPNQILIYQRVR